MPYLTAEQVKDAYTTPLPIAQIQGIGDTLAQNRILADRRRKEQSAQQLQGLGLVSEAIDPISKGTGFSPYDDLNSSHIGAVKQQATQMVMKGADPASVYMYLQNATNGIRARQQDVLKGIQNADTWAKSAAEKDPALDYGAMRQQYLDNIFYNKDDKGNKSFNPSFNTSVDFTQGVTPVYDPVKLKQLSIAELPKIFPEQQSPDVAGAPGFSYSAKVPSYLMPDGKSKQTVWNAEPLEIKGRDGNVMQLPAIKSDIADKLFAAPNTGRYLKANFDSLRKSLPAHVSDGDIRRIVASDFLQQHGQQPGGGVEEDDSEYQRNRQARRDSEDSYYKAQNLGFRQRADARAQQRLDKQGQSNATDPYLIGKKWMVDDLPNDSPEKSLVDIHTVKVPGIASPVFDISGVSGKGFLNDPITGNPIKVGGYKDPETRQKTLAIQHYRKATPKEVENGANAYTPTGEVTKLSGKDMVRFYTSIASQLQTQNKQKNFNEVLGELDSED